MDDKFNKMMDKKKDGKEMDPMYKHAKMSMLKALKDEMSGMMKDDISSGPMKKVEVAADDKQGLVEGLDKAKHLLGGGEDHEDDMPEDEHAEPEHDDMIHKAYGEMGLMPEDEQEEEPELDHEEPDGDEMSDDEMEQLQMLLDKMKKAKMSKKY
jgi:hypothetical protein